MRTFQTFGEFALALRADTIAGRAASTFGSTASGPDGGYAVPTNFVEQIFLTSEGALAPRCQVIPSQSSEILVPTDESTPWGTSGILAGWDSEGSTATGRKPALSMATHRLHKLRALVPLSGEFVQDSKAVNAWLPQALQKVFDWQVNNAIVNGPGTARPLGILKSSAVIDVAAEGGQTAGTIVDANISAMLARSLSPLSSTWLASPAAYSQLHKLSSFDSATRTLAGLPIALTDACAAPGARGDIILAKLGGYRIVTKEARFANSTHLYFDQDLVAFRLTVQLDGQPVLSAPVTPPNSAVTRSDFVALAARS